MCKAQVHVWAKLEINPTKLVCQLLASGFVQAAVATLQLGCSRWCYQPEQPIWPPFAGSSPAKARAKPVLFETDLAPSALQRWEEGRISFLQLLQVQQHSVLQTSPKEQCHPPQHMAVSQPWARGCGYHSSGLEFANS